MSTYIDHFEIAYIDGKLIISVDSAPAIGKWSDGLIRALLNIAKFVSRDEIGKENE